MPISQLLASITGEKPSIPSSSSTAPPPLRSSNGLPPAKRKAEEESRGGASQKTPRTATTNGTARPNGDGAKPSRPTTGYAGSARPSATSSPRPLSERPATAAAPSAATKKTSMSTSNARSTPPTSTLANRPAPASSSDPAGGKAPKKGSIAEIKARAAAQQAKLHSIGKIQHKATEKLPTKKEREEAAAEEARLAKKGLKPGVMKRGASVLSRGNSNSSGGHLDRSRGAIQKPAAPGAKNGKAPVVEEKKVKKAALATTGYTGSARPPPGGSKAKAGPAKPGLAGAGRDQRDKRPNPMGMFSKPRRSRDEDYDEELEDFVVDDEEEDDDGYGYAHRYRYADQDDDSDMEAGYSDVEDEEAAAARLARLEDAREEALLEQKRREKEARKKAALAQSRR